MRRLLLSFGVVLSACMPCASQAEDIITRYRTPGGTQSIDARPDYNGAVIAEAMRRTEKKYGPYRIQFNVGSLARDRLLAELATGEEVNLAVVVTQPTWEDRLIPVRIPIDMGLSGYRFSMIHADSKPKLAALRTASALKELTIAAGAGWSSRKVFEADGFAVRPGENYDALLKLIVSKRADLFPRAINEIFAEFDEHAPNNPELAIDDSLLIYVPLPTYIFVSPKAARIAARLNEGMESMLRDGSLQRLMLEYNKTLIERAKLCGRRMFRLDNPTLSALTPINRPEVWFDPFDRKHGICTKAIARRPQR